MNTLLWVLQVFLGIFFMFNAYNHFTLPDGLPAMFAWMYELNPGLHMFSGTAELLGGLGLILPGLTKIQPRLTTFAAAGLVIVMGGAIVHHIGRGEIVPQAVMNIVLAALCAFIAYGRWKLVPLPEKDAS